MTLFCNLFMERPSYILTAPTHGEMARLSWPRWLGYIPRRYTGERSPIPVLTWLSVE